MAPIVRDLPPGRTIGSFYGEPGAAPPPYLVELWAARLRFRRAESGYKRALAAFGRARTSFEEAQAAVSSNVVAHSEAQFSPEGLLQASEQFRDSIAPYRGAFMNLARVLPERLDARVAHAELFGRGDVLNLHWFGRKVLADCRQELG